MIRLWGDLRPAERTGLLIRHCSPILSYDQMREVLRSLGVAATRNAILGHVKRNMAEWKPTMDKSSEQLQRRINNRLQERINRPASPPEPPAPEIVPVEDSTDLEKLTKQSCRFPLWGNEAPTLMFCGKWVKEGSPYCDHHHKITHVRVPIPEKKRKDYA